MVVENEVVALAVETGDVLAIDQKRRAGGGERCIVRFVGGGERMRFGGECGGERFLGTMLLDSRTLLSDASGWP